MTVSVVITAAILVTWLWLACRLPRLREPNRQRAQWVLIAFGVPILGWLTLNWGPMIGVASFAFGIVALVFPPGRRGGGGARPPVQ